MNIKLDLFLTFFKLGATTFGGGHAMVSMLKEVVIDKKFVMEKLGVEKKSKDLKKYIL